MICIPICGETNAAMLEAMNQAHAEPAALHEIRFDSLREAPDVDRLVKSSSRPVIATCRSVKEGGGFAGSHGERRNILRSAVLAGAAYVDGETDDLDYLDFIGDSGASIRIASMHDFAGTPDNLLDQIHGLADLPAADWVKFAVTAERFSDNVRVFSALEACPKPAIGLAMGDRGLPSRILGGKFGSRVTFGSLRRGDESAPGQPTARELAEIYRVDSISGKTALFGLAAFKEPGSCRYDFNNEAFIAAGIDAICIPCLTSELHDFLDMLDAVGKMPGKPIASLKDSA